MIIMRCFFFEPMVSLLAVVGMQRQAYFCSGFVTCDYFSTLEMFNIKRDTIIDRNSSTILKHRELSRGKIDVDPDAALYTRSVT